MLNSLCNHQQQPRVWKINCTLAKGTGNCFARYTTKSCLQAIHLSDVCKKKKKKSAPSFLHLRVMVDYCEQYIRAETKRCQRELEVISYLCQRQRRQGQAADSCDVLGRRQRAVKLHFPLTPKWWFRPKFVVTNSFFHIMSIIMQVK